MKVGMLTSWNTKCGISEYSRYLVNAIRRLSEVDLYVFGSKNYDDYAVSDYQEDYEIPTFGVLPWNRHGDHSFDGQRILEKELDILHVQYECVLYNQEPFYQLLHALECPKVITYHDNCIPQDFPYYRFDLAYTHRGDVGIGSGYLLSMALEERVPVVKTFGLGRSRKDIIGEICERNGWEFHWSFGDTIWKTQEELYRWLRDSDLIVLYYDDAPAAGTSIAARVAQSTRRPLIVSDSTWFKDLNDSVSKVRTPEELELQMHLVLDRDWVTWDDIAHTHIEDYKECLG